VRVTDADTAPELEGAPFLVMELLLGHDVERLLLQRGKLDARETLAILMQVARGLDHAHAAGVIHRDLKPENVFVHRRDDGSEIVKILDFGISKVLRPDGDLGSVGVVATPETMGTPLYMAPEQASEGHDPIGPATDVWAVGLMTLRMLTGDIYWTGETIHEVFLQIMSERRTAPSERWPALVPRFDAWFLKSTALHAADRFQSVGEQIAELSLVLTGERSSDPFLRDQPSSRAPMELSVSAEGPPSRRARRRPARVTAVAVGLVLAVGVVIAVVPRLRPRETTPSRATLAAAPAPATPATEPDAGANADASANANANANANAGE
jgi:serine/threonine protein kinase